MKRLLPVIVIFFACTSQKSESILKGKQEVLPSSTSQSDLKENLEQKEVYALSTLTTRIMLNKVEVLVPHTFKIMDTETVALKYLLKKGTTFQVYTDDDATVNVAFEHLPNKASSQDLPVIKQVFEQQFNQPNIDFKKSEIRKINGRDFIVMEMITPTMDTEVYNLMFVTCSEGRLLIGTFNCTIAKIEVWQSIGEKMLNSITLNDL